MKKYVNWLVVGAAGVSSLLLIKELCGKKQKSYSNINTQNTEENNNSSNEDENRSFHPIPNATESIDDDDDDLDD